MSLVKTLFAHYAVERNCGRYNRRLEIFSSFKLHRGKTFNFHTIVGIALILHALSLKNNKSYYYTLQKVNLLQ